MCSPDNEDDWYEYVRHIEECWRASLPRMSDIEWLDIFPEMKGCLRVVLEELEREEKYWDSAAKKKCSETKNTRYENKAWVEIAVYIKPRIQKLQKDITRVRRQIAYLERGRDSGAVTQADIEMARSVPIESFLPGKIQRMGNVSKTNCPFHNDKSPSFVVYRNKNNAWCFGCNQGGDAITIIRLLHKLTFIEAVNYL